MFPLTSIFLVSYGFTALSESATIIGRHHKIDELRSNGSLVARSFPLQQCDDKTTKFENGTFSAICEKQRPDAGPPEMVQTSIQLNTCIANVAGNLKFRAEQVSSSRATNLPLTSKKW